MTREVSFEEMSAVLKQNGWEQLWHETNWVKSEWVNDPDINIDWAGRSTEQAYQMVLDENRV